MNGPLSDVRLGLLAHFAADASLVAMVPRNRHFSMVPRHAAEPWLALDAARVFNNGSSLSEGHRIEMQVQIATRPRQTDAALAIGHRVAQLIDMLQGPVGGTHVVVIHAGEQILGPVTDEAPVRLTVTLVAFTEPL